MEAMWNLSVKRWLGWGAHGECYTRQSKCSIWGHGPLLHLSPAPCQHFMVYTYCAYSHCQFRPLWTISKPSSSKKTKKNKEREREVLIVTIMEVLPHHTRNLSSDVN